MILKLPSSDTAARCLLSGENANAFIGCLATFQYATGLNFWFFEFTDLAAKKPDVDLRVSPSSRNSSGLKGASSFSLS